MAAGKSSVGRKLARRLRREFIDSDKRIVAAHGPIATIFQSLGESGFRALEAEAVRGALGENTVIALGGGAVLHEQTRELLAGTTVVLLTIDERTAERRIGGTSRPLLVDGGIDAWRRIAQERAPLYASLADITIDGSGRPVMALVDELIDRLKEVEQ